MNRAKRSLPDDGHPLPPQKVAEGTCSTGLGTSSPGWKTTLRISNIPITTEQSLSQILEGLTVRRSATSGGAVDTKRRREENILGFSLAPSPSASDSHRYQVMTVTFKEIPCNIRPRMWIGPTGAEFEVDVDTHFKGLTPLNNPSNPLVDIIAITGLGGHAFGSWRSRVDHVMWLRDILPVDLQDNGQNARIFTYGYDTTLVGSTSDAVIKDLSRLFLDAVNSARPQEDPNRPIIFIAHSLGGLVIKQTLIDAHRNHRDFFRSCYSMLFFGVPNKGLENSSLMAMVNGQPNSKLVHDLGVNSQFLSLLDDSFCQLLKPLDIKVISFYELHDTKAVKEIALAHWARAGEYVRMVTRESAISSLSNGESGVILLHADHSAIVKFDCRSDQNYKPVQTKVLELTKAATEAIGRRFAVQGRGEAEHTNYHPVNVNVRGEQVRDAEEKRREDRMAKLSWLFPGDPDEKHIDIRQKRHEGTGGWFFDTEEFKNWLRDPCWLFCHGKPGTGKTVLTSTAFDHIAGKIPATDGLAHIYCGFKDREEQTPTKIFASILRQLGFQKSELPSEIESLHEKFMSTGKKPLLEDLTEAIISLTSSFSCVWLFFDALDECDETTLQNLLPRIQDLMKTDIKGFVTSRSHVSEIQSTFEKAIKMELSARRQDMEVLVRSRSSTRFATGLVEEIVSRVLEKADGIFLLAAFQVEFIMKKKRPADVRKCLNKLPTGLEGIYEKILHKINQDDEDNKELALNALSWISHATRPLRPRELIEALTIAENDSTIEAEDLFDEKDLVDVCGGLVMIDENSETVRFVHYTVQEHLDKTLDVPRGTHVHAMMAKICLTYLSFDTFSQCPHSGMDTRWLAKRLGDNAFYEYAACNWVYHTKSSDEEKSVVEMICTFSETGNRMESALHAFLSNDHLSKGQLAYRNRKLENSRNTISVAAMIGLPQLAKSLVQLENLEVDLKDKNSNSRTALSRAAEHGHLAVVELLVDRDDVAADSKDSYWGKTPLSRAAENGHLAVVELLVDRDDVAADSKDTYGGTPLSRAAGNGHLAVVELLVDRDDVAADSKDSLWGQTPLSWAAGNGHLAVVELLKQYLDSEKLKKQESNLP